MTKKEKKAEEKKEEIKVNDGIGNATTGHLSIYRKQKGYSLLYPIGCSNEDILDLCDYVYGCIEKQTEDCEEEKEIEVFLKPEKL